VGDVRIRVSYYSDTNRIDEDNLKKPIQDALQGIVYLNDRQVKQGIGRLYDINVALKVRYMSEALAMAFSDGRPFHTYRGMAQSRHGACELMATATQTAYQRTRRRIAATYRKGGYHVAVPSASNAVPTFLQGYSPDLIAEKDDDRVVIEIKAIGSLKGANDLVELAERVHSQPGWRLELVTFKAPDPDATIASPDWLNRMLQPPKDDRFNCFYRLEVLGFLIRSVALQLNLKVSGQAESAIGHQLAFEGVIEPALASRIDDAFRWKANLLRGHTHSPSAAEQAVELENLCRDILAQAPTPEE
jgi:hypothetical protein